MHKKIKTESIYDEIIEKDDYYCASKRDGTYVRIDKDTLKEVFKTKK